MDNMGEIIQRILLLIDSSGLTDKQILNGLDISSKSTLISEWRSGKSKSPQIKHIIKIADFFNVGVDFLITGEISASNLCDKEKELLLLFRALPDHSKERVIGYIKGSLDTIKEKALD